MAKVILIATVSLLVAVEAMGDFVPPTPRPAWLAIPLALVRSEGALLAVPGPAELSEKILFSVASASFFTSLVSVNRLFAAEFVVSPARAVAGDEKVFEKLCRVWGRCAAWIKRDKAPRTRLTPRSPGKSRRSRSSSKGRARSRSTAWRDWRFVDLTP